jgi:hypothetical protein
MEVCRLQEGVHLHTQELVRNMIWDRDEDECHRLVDTYTKLMKHELDENFFKGDREEWQGGMSLAEGLNEIRYHLEKLEVAVDMKDKERIVEHAADVGNCCMIFLDLMGYIQPVPLVKEEPPTPAPRNAISHSYAFDSS